MKKRSGVSGSRRSRPQRKRIPKPYRHQRQALRKVLALGGRAGLFMEVGCGKTRVAIDAAVALGAQRAVVVVPVPGMLVWRDEVRKWAPQARTVTCYEGSVQESARKLRRYRRRYDHFNRTRLSFVLVNYQAYWRRPLRQEIERWKPDIIIYDEAHRLKTRGSKQSRFAHTFTDSGTKKHSPQFLLALTGTPTPNGHQDIFSIFKATDPDVFGRNWERFSERFLRWGGYYGHQVVGYYHERELRKKVRRHSYRTTKAEALDLPEEVDVTVPVQLSKQTRKYYDQMAEEAVAEIEGFQGSGTAFARLAVVTQIRLQQIASGFVKVEDGQVLDFGTEKQDALASLLEDVILDARRVVVYCHWTHDVDAALATARRIVGEEAVFRLDGRDKKLDQMAKAIKGFRSGDPSVLVAQVQKASETLDFSRAHVAIFYSRDWSLLNWEQARGRLHRKNQENKVTYYALVAEKTIDLKIQRALTKKEELMFDLHDRDRLAEFIRP